MTNEMDTGNQLISDLDWAAKIALETANFSRIKDAFEVMVPRYSLFAKQYRIYFLVLTAEGFTSEQALEIVKVHGWIPR